MMRGDKTSAVREYFRRAKDASPRSVVEGLKSQVISVSASFVANVKSKMKREKPMKEVFETQPENGNKIQFNENHVQILQQVKKLTVNYSLDEIKSAVALLESIAD